MTMKFTKRLSHSELNALNKQEFQEYLDWLGELEKEKRKEKTKNWTLEDWGKEAFTFNNYAAARRDFFLKEEKIDELVAVRLNGEKEKFTFFWETQSPFSQWHPSPFLAPVYMWENDFSKQLIKNGYPADIQFTSAEQYMMYCKAMLFIDLEMAQEILKTANPRKIKELGRQVRRFNEDTWYVYRWRFVYQGNKYKFTQNEELKKALFSTQGTTLVEASPYDKIWGIGLSKDNPKAQLRSTWDGKNLLGEILTELRVELMGNYQEV